MKILNISPVSHELICREHGIIDSAPCPWPNCKNGIPDDKFQVDWGLPLSNKKNLKTYSRHEWKSPLGGSYYTWDVNDQGSHFLSSKKTILNEARRHRLMPFPAKYPETLYHYTTLEGFVGIVRDGAIWLSDYSYLNDKRELTQGADLVIEIADKMCGAYGNIDVEKLLESWRKNVSDIQNRVVIASFSGKGDDLSQWRAYGSIAIGFDARALSLHASDTRLNIVEYNSDKQKKLIEIYLHHLCQAYEADIKIGLTQEQLSFYKKPYVLLEFIAFFEDSAFQSENEYRLISIENQGTLDSFGFSNIPKQFRVSGNHLIPYVSSKDTDPSKRDNPSWSEKFPLKISEVVLGPQTDELLERGVQEFLNSEDKNEVAIRRSSIPYRT